VKDLKQLKTLNINNGVLFNYNNPIEAMFYTNLIVYPNIPDKNIIKNLQQKGYKIFINTNEYIPEDIKSLNGIITVKLSKANN
jgi:hypothetical protein